MAGSRIEEHQSNKQQGVAMQPETPAIAAAIERCVADPARVARYVRLLLEHVADQTGYWAEATVLLLSVHEDVWDAHISECLNESCRTCAALREASAVYDAFETAEQARCICPVGGGGVDHFTTDCSPDRTWHRPRHT
jgi:hypothetical protein